MNGGNMTTPVRGGSTLGVWLRRLLLWPTIRALLVHLRPGRVPVLLQMSQVECGAACLAMVLCYYGRTTRVADLREPCGVGRDGLTAQTIAQAAHAHGLRVKAFSLEPGDFRHVPLPAIVHWSFNHF